MPNEKNEKKESNSVRERRFIRASELRARTGDKPGIEGYAAVFNQRSEELGGWMSFREIIMPGAFGRAIKEKQDVRALVNHDPSQLIGRTKNGTLTLREDDHGLFFSVDLPDTQNARDLAQLIDRGDIDGCSFGFRAVKQKWGEEPDPADPDKMMSVRELHDVDLFDVSAVTYPAYTGTSVDSRTLWPDGVPDEVRQHVELREKKTKKVDGVDLTSDCFAYVGDENDTSTWKLPIKFPGDEEKTKSHIRNALARFSQTKGIPADQKDTVWKKIVAAAKAHDIKVTEEDSLRARTAIEHRQDEGNENGCECDCTDCEDDNCESCTSVDCDDEACQEAGCPMQEQDVEENSLRERMSMALELADRYDLRDWVERALAAE